MDAHSENLTLRHHLNLKCDEVDKYRRETADLQNKINTRNQQQVGVIISSGTKRTTAVSNTKTANSWAERCKGEDNLITGGRGVGGGVGRGGGGGGGGGRVGGLGGEKKIRWVQYFIIISSTSEGASCYLHVEMRERWRRREKKQGRIHDSISRVRVGRLSMASGQGQ